VTVLPVLGSPAGRYDVHLSPVPVGVVKLSVAGAERWLPGEGKEASASMFRHHV